MSNLTIITNNKPRELVSFLDLPVQDRKDFDYIEEDDEYSIRFVQYKGAWYDVHDAQFIAVRRTNRPMGWEVRVESEDPLARWDAIVSETFFSGVLFKFVDDEQVIVGRYMS